MCSKENPHVVLEADEIAAEFAFIPQGPGRGGLTAGAQAIARVAHRRGLHPNELPHAVEHFMSGLILQAIELKGGNPVDDYAGTLGETTRAAVDEYRRLDGDDTTTA